MRRFGLLIIFFAYNYPCVIAQEIKVSTISKNINASGGLTVGPDGNLYVSDFGKSFQDTSLTSVYKVKWGSWQVTEFAKGFRGASGNYFDNRGNFYQSNPKGHKISKINTDGTVNYDWATKGLVTPIGLVTDDEDILYVCNCGSNSISRVTTDGDVSLFAEGDLFNCPNGITRDPLGNLYVCNFNDGKVLKITPKGKVSIFTQLPELQGPKSNLGNGHLTWKNNFLFVTTIGTGEIFKVNMKGEPEKITGLPAAFSNLDGDRNEASFSKPNGIIASPTGDTLIINVSDANWKETPGELHPAHLRMVTGVRSFTDFDKEFIRNDLMDLEWILGKWTRSDLKDGKGGYESWTQISKTKFKGEGVRMKDGVITFREDLILEVKQDNIYYGAYVEENEQWIFFKLINKGNNYFAVENPAHDFPKKIIYNLESAGSLKAQISGLGRAVNFAFTR